MHLTDHVTDVQLNEYLDHESAEREQIETHISSCADCAARLTALQALFAEIESLPELPLTHDLTARFTPTPSLPVPQLPVIEISNLMITLTLAGISMLWLIGNGLLLRNQR